MKRVLARTRNWKALLTLQPSDVATEHGLSRERYRRAALTTFTFLVAGAGLVLGTLGFFPVRRAQAFTSFLHGNWHGQITWSALRVVMQSRSGCRPSDAAAAVVMNSNLNQDLLEMSLDSSDHLVPKASGRASYANCPAGWEPCPYRPEHHFDRVRSLSEDSSADVSAFESGLRYVVAKRSRIGQMVADNRTRAALIALGRGLHAVQDVFSHSNYVDLYDGRSLATDELTADLLGTDVTTPPASLILTRLDWRDANPESPADADAPPGPSYAGFPYTHLRMAKDWDAENAEAGLPMGGKNASFTWPRAQRRRHPCSLFWRLSTTLLDSAARFPTGARTIPAWITPIRATPTNQGNTRPAAVLGMPGPSPRTSLPPPVRVRQLAEPPIQRA